MTEKRFVKLKDTHIGDQKTGHEFYAPGEDELIDLLKELNEENYKLTQGYNTILQFIHKILLADLPKHEPVNCRCIIEPIRNGELNNE